MPEFQWLAEWDQFPLQMQLLYDVTLVHVHSFYPNMFIPIQHRWYDDIYVGFMIYIIFCMECGDTSVTNIYVNIYLTTVNICT